MTGVEHTILSVALLAVSFYLGKFLGVSVGFQEGVESTLSYLDEDELAKLVMKIQKEKDDVFKE